MSYTINEVNESHAGHPLPTIRSVIIRDTAGTIIGEIRAVECIHDWMAWGYRSDGSWSQLDRYEFRNEAESAVRAWAANEGRVAA